MGLAGRKEKQRIGNDPRNLSWADDANKFGAAYLQKLGWSAGTGLGTNGDGRTSHIKVSQKLDMLGIGAAHQKDPNGIAWKQNKDFENLLRRLNGGEGAAEGGTKVDGFAKAGESLEGEEKVGEESEDGKKKKRKRSKETDEGESSKKKKRKEEGEDKDKKKKRKESGEDDAAPSTVESPLEPSSSSVKPTPPLGPPRRAHRARFMAAKRQALNAGSAMDEILGISRSGTATPYPTTSIPETPTDTPAEEDVKLQELTTSSKSVMDYFKEKLLAKSNAATPSSSTPAGASSPQADVADEDDYDRPRGLGVGAARGLGSRLRMETYEEEEVTEKRGLGIKSQFASMFASASASIAPSPEAEKTGLVEGKEGKKKKDKKGKEKLRDESEVGEKKKRKKRETLEGEEGSPTEEANVAVEDGTEGKSKRRKDKEGKKKKKAKDA
ncbi:hypothetical protein BXZ70DRAFT_1001036 [Cristinia sonorae]|uniref:PinX1-related protein 1 n=1 Tax=Cristinia sonorae TaxID=1940300 RepID=A0A8K0XN91_9AGAR|nr:hypothetical protein BXZ70DRAFT_1001036 [Cristinia sonorae]